MKINAQKNGNTLSISIDGSIDSVTAPELEKYLASEREGVAELVLDFGAVDYISSAGLRVILEADKHFSKTGKMTVKNVNDDVREVFEITGLDELLDI